MLNSSEFVDQLDSSQHILQIITDDIKGKNTQFQFLENGLLKGEYCIYLTHENPDKIKNKMQEFGIDVDRFIHNNLHIHRVPNLLKHPDGALMGFRIFFDVIMPNPKPKFRLVGRAIHDITTQEGWNAEIEIEQFVHSAFDLADGMILCCYEHKNLGRSKTMSRIVHLLGCHSGVIFSTFAEPNLAYSLSQD